MFSKIQKNEKKEKLREKETKAKDGVFKIKIHLNPLKQFYFWHHVLCQRFVLFKKLKLDNKQVFSTPELRGL